VTYSVVAVVVAWGEPERALPSVVDAQSCWTFKIDWTVYFGVGILQVWRGNNFGRMVALVLASVYLCCIIARENNSGPLH